MPIPVSELNGIGPYMTRMLAEIGLTTIEELSDLGAVEAYARLRFVVGKSVNLNALYGMDAALRGVDWRHMPAARKEELQAALRDRAGSQNE